MATLALLLLAPKCLLCAAAFAGIGTALGLGGPEICGAPPEHGTPWLLPLSVLVTAFAATVLLRRTVAKIRRPAISS